MKKEQFLKNLSVPTGVIDIVLDTDAYNEIDDQFAISYMLKSPERFNIKAILAAPFLNSRSTSPEEGMVKSYEEIHKLLELLGMSELKEQVYCGSRKYLSDEKTPVISPAASYLAELAKEYSPEKPLYVVAIGAITNVASALLLNPDIRENTVIVWLGGHGEHIPTPGCEFNMQQDIAAARVVFGSGVPLVQLPCVGVVDAFSSSKYELTHWLRGKNALCDYLLAGTIEEADSYAEGKPWTRVIWDVTAVGWLLNDGERFMSSRITDRFMPEYDKSYSYEAGAAPMRYVYHIERDFLFEDLFEKLAK